MAFPYSLYNGIQQLQGQSPVDRRDLLNYTGDNTIQSARYINPLTRDFEVSATNHFLGENAVEQAVLLAMNTTFNSSVLTGFGQNFGSIKVITPFIKNQIAANIKQALSFLIQNNQITLGEIDFSNNGLGQVAIQFAYANNTLNTEATLTFIL